MSASKIFAKGVREAHGISVCTPLEVALFVSQVRKTVGRKNLRKQVSVPGGDAGADSVSGSAAVRIFSASRRYSLFDCPLGPVLPVVAQRLRDVPISRASVCNEGLGSFAFPSILRASRESPRLWVAPNRILLWLVPRQESRMTSRQRGARFGGSRRPRSRTRKGRSTAVPSAAAGVREFVAGCLVGSSARRIGACSRMRRA